MLPSLKIFEGFILLVICLCRLVSLGCGNKIAPHFSGAVCKKSNLSYIQETRYLFHSLISCLLKTFILKHLQSLLLSEYESKFCRIIQNILFDAFTERQKLLNFFMQLMFILRNIL
jgi:hypothetical protein